MLQLEEAQQRILGQIQPLSSELATLNEGVGRILAEDIVSPLDLPLFDNSAMDGYAVRSADVANASANSPARLKRIGEVAAGHFLSSAVSTGACVRIFTGSPLPGEADAIVMQEDTREHDGIVEVIEAVKPWENVRFRGEDVKRGAPVARKGDEVTIGLTALFGALGISHVSVARRPVVALLSTGSELIEAGQPLAPGKIYESNRIALAALLSRAGALPRIFPLVADTPSATCAALEQAFVECDVVVTTGGVSVGEFDCVKATFQSLGGELDFWRVAIRPGKPFVFGKWLDKILFGLPGNPLSAFVTCLLLVRPAILKLQGANAPFLPSHIAVLGEPLVNRSDRRHFVRIVVDHDGMVRSAGLQASHALSSFARAHGLVEVRPNTTLPAGASVRVLRWEF